MTIAALALIAATMLKDDPCEGCAASIPKADAGPLPLLVVLHGDYGATAPQIERTWAKHATPRGIAVLAIACPKAQGCQGSFWRWNGDPAWIVAQVDALAAKHSIDPERTWIAGWSGGATYIGMHTQVLEKRFAAIVHHGGGYPPLTSGCASPGAPVYFLVGDANPLHDHVKLLRDHYASCGNALVWNVTAHADHAAEWRALDTHAPALFEWLSTKRLQPTPIDPSPSPSAPPPAPVPSASASPITAPPPPSTPPPRGCGCTIASATAPAAPSLLLLAPLLAARRRRRRSRYRASTVLK
jgi:predicted esterase